MSHVVLGQDLQVPAYRRVESGKYSVFKLNILSPCGSVL